MSIFIPSCKKCGGLFTKIPQDMDGSPYCRTCAIEVAAEKGVSQEELKESGEYRVKRIN